MMIVIDMRGTVTNGDMIKAMFNPYKICEYEYSVHIYMTEENFLKAEYQMNCDTSWWNAPYTRFWISTKQKERDNDNDKRRNRQCSRRN